MNRKFIVVFLFLLVFGSCSRGDKPDFDEKMDTNPKITGADYENGQTTVKTTEQESITDAPTQITENDNEPKTEISALLFGSESLCEYIRNNFDGNEDGYLSDAERALVKDISSGFDEEGEMFAGKSGEILKGFDCFPNLETIDIEVDGAENIIVKNVPKLKTIHIANHYTAEEIEGVEIENCESLQELYCCGLSGVLSVKNCENLELYIGDENNGSEMLQFEGCPKLWIASPFARNIITSADVFVSNIPNNSIAYETKEGNEVVSSKSSRVNYEWCVNGENVYIPETDFPNCYYSEHDFDDDFYSFEVLGPQMSESGEENLYYCCVTYVKEPVRKESFSVIADTKPSKEDFFVKAEDANDMLYIAYSPSKGLLTRITPNIGLYYRGKNGVQRLGGLSNKYTRYFAVDVQKQSRFFNNVKEMLEHFGLSDSVSWLD